MKKKAISLALTCALMSSFAFAAASDSRAPAQSQANKGEYQPARGWHFYELPPEIMEMIDKKIEKEVEKRVAEKMEEQKEKAPAAGSSEWLKVNIPKARMAAADDPSTQNIKTLLLMEKMMRDKGRRLAEKAASVSVVDPVLDGSYRSTSNIHNARARRDKIASNQAEVFSNLVKNEEMVFWLFVDDECTSCASWTNALAQLNIAHGVKALFLLPNKDVQIPEPFLEIKDGDWEYLTDSKSIRDKLNIKKNEISLFAYNGKKKEYVNIARGFVATHDIIPRVLVAADFTGWISNKEAELTKFGVVRNDLANIGDEKFEGDPDDLNAYAEYIYQRLLENSDD